MGYIRTANASALATNSVLRNTFLLLGATLAFSSLTAFAAIVTNSPVMNPWAMLLIYFVLLFAVSATKQSALGLVFCFALTGFLGYTAGPIIGLYISAGMGNLVALALGCTAAMFIGLAGYATITQKDFSYMTGFLMSGILTAFVLGLVAMIFHIQALSLVVSAAFVILSSGLILWQISNIIHGGETNYISATVTLYVSIYNIFMSLLRIFSSFNR